MGYLTRVRFVCVSPTIITPHATSICSMWTIQCSTVDASIVCCRPSGWMFFLIQQGGSPLTALPTPHRGFPEVSRGLRLVPPGRLERPHPAPEAGALSAELWGPAHCAHAGAHPECITRLAAPQGRRSHSYAIVESRARVSAPASNG